MGCESFSFPFVFFCSLHIWQGEKQVAEIATRGFLFLHTAHVCALIFSGVPEELLPDPEGILMGGGRCFTPFPKRDVWTSGEIPSPCRRHIKQHVSHGASPQQPKWTATQLVRLKRLFLQQFVNKMTESSAKKVYRFPSPTFMGDTHLIFAGGGRPLSHAAWVMGHLDLTLYIPLIHPFVLSKKPTKQTWRKMYAMLPNRQNFDRLDGWQKQTWHLTGLHRS